MFEPYTAEMKLNHSVVLFFVTMSFFMQNTSAQTTYPIGVYLSLEDLRTKAPSLQVKATVEKRSAADKAMMGGNDFKITSTNEGVSKDDIKRSWVAYSDGVSLYINGFQFDIQIWYCQVLDEGGLLLFKGAMNDKEAVGVAVAGGAIGAAAASGAERLYALDLRTIEAERMKKGKMGEYLSEYPEILADYENEPKKLNAEVQLKYLKKINGGIDGSKVTPNSSYEMELTNSKPVYLVLYRMHKKELPIPVELTIQDSISYNAIPDSYWWKKCSTADSVVNICSASSNKADCVELDITKGGTYYVFVSLNEKTKTPLIHLVGDGEGEWDSELARKAELKRAKKSAKE